MIKDIVDALKVVSEGIASVTAIVDAVKNGTHYLKTTHPEVQADVRSLVAELAKSVRVVKEASAVMTNFSFAVAPDTGSVELARFNDYFIKSKAEMQFLRDHIDDLRTHCSRIREHALAIGNASTSDGFMALFRTVLNLNDPAREQALSEKLDRLAFEDFALANAADLVVQQLEASLTLVQRTLGDGRVMRAENVPAAAAVLAELGPPFEQLELQATQALGGLRQTATALG